LDAIDFGTLSGCLQHLGSDASDEEEGHEVFSLEAGTGSAPWRCQDGIVFFGFFILWNIMAGCTCGFKSSGTIEPTSWNE
jgi:hypothetical protein